MRAPLGDRLRVTVLGCSTAAPHPASPTAGFLVEWGSTALLLDVGQGVIRNLQRVLDPLDLSAVILGHMHADHYLDIVGLRYLFPWGEPAETPLPMHIPPGGRQRLDALAVAISERVGFFDAAFDAVEFDPALGVMVGELRVRFVRGRHYVPAWGVVIDAPDGARLAYSGDTGPSDSVAAGLADADLLLVEAALRDSRFDDLERGHLTAEEALDLARAARAREAMLVHYAPIRRAELEGLCRAAGPWAHVAVDGLTMTVEPGERSAAVTTAIGVESPS